MRRLVWAICLAAVGCSSYPYRHDIEGRVVAGGQPLEGAIVQRLNEKGEPYGFDDDYRRTTDAAGKFAFVAEGRGPSPLRYAPWTLQVSHEKFGTRELEVRAQWSDDKASCWGYCARDFDIDLK